MLRSETVLLLQMCGVDAQDLVFSDDACVAGLLERTAQVVLTDHNVADGPLIPLGDKVIEILDHHKDFEKHPQVQGDKRNIAFEGTAATAASACTVLGERFLSDAQGKQLLERHGGAAARALLGVILIDSCNLEPKAKKVCARDIAAAGELSKYVSKQKELSQNDEPDFFRQLDCAKFDAVFWQSLKIDQCLRYDYKRFESNGKVCGLSSMLCPLNCLFSKEGWAEGMAEYAKGLDLFGVLVMTKGDDGEITRELSFVSREPELAAHAGKFLEAYEGGLLQLDAPKGKVAADAQGPMGMVVFRQGNTAASRKQVAPGCIEFLASL